MNERLLERTKEIVLKCAEFVLTFPKWVLSPLREVMDTLPARTEGDEIVQLPPLPFLHEYNLPLSAGWLEDDERERSESIEIETNLVAHVRVD